MIKKRVLAFILMSLLLLSFSVQVFAMDADGVTVAGSISDKGAFYGRFVRLDNGDLLATWMREFPVANNFAGGMEPYQFHKSSDNGKTWHVASTLDAGNYPGLSPDKMGMHTLFVLPEQMGTFPKGTILFACNDWDDNQEYTIHIWRSTDNGNSWVKHADVAKRSGGIGGRIWEPEFAVGANGELIIYYSDERQDGYDQCLSLETSNDGGLTWGNYTIITGKYIEGWERGVSPTAWRPGMPRVIKLLNGQYLLIFENIGVLPDGRAGNGIMSFKLSNDGINWGNPEDIGSTISVGASEARQCPAIALMDDGSPNGRLFVRGMGDTCSPSMCFSSRNNGQSWELVEAPLTAVRNERVGSNWSSSFLVDGNTLYELNNYYNGSYNEIRFGFSNNYNGQMIVSSADYRIVNAGSGLYLDDAGGSMDKGNQMIQWHANNLDTQSWHAKNIEEDWYTFTCNFSNLLLDNYNGLSVPETPVIQWEENGRTAQQWKLIPSGNGQFKIQNRDSGLFMDVINNSSSAAAGIVVNPESGSQTQLWRLERIFEIARFESYNIGERFIRHTSGGKVIIDTEFTALPLKDSEWRIVPGLSDASCISLESINKPGYYLRHINGEVILSKNDGSDILKKDATWRIKPGLSNSSAVSLETYLFQGIYLRHIDGKIKISAINTALDKADATFHMILQ